MARMLILSPTGITQHTTRFALINPAYTVTAFPYNNFHVYTVQVTQAGTMETVFVVEIFSVFELERVPWC
jgi:hypothetical protein